MKTITLPTLQGYSMTDAVRNRQSYIEWINEKGFLKKKYAFTFIDFSLILKYTKLYYKANFTHMQCEEIENIFYDNYTIYTDNEFYIRPEAQIFGYDAVKSLTDTFSWLEITSEASYQDLFNRCIRSRFQKYPKLVSYIEELKKKGELDYVQ